MLPSKLPRHLPEQRRKRTSSRSSFLGIAKECQYFSSRLGRTTLVMLIDSLSSGWCNFAPSPRRYVQYFDLQFLFQVDHTGQLNVLVQGPDNCIFTTWSLPPNEFQRFLLQGLLLTSQEVSKRPPLFVSLAVGLQSLMSQYHASMTHAECEGKV